MNPLQKKNQYVADPVPAYANSTQTVKQTIQNSSLDEFATMLFSVAATLKKDKKLLGKDIKNICKQVYGRNL